MRCDETNGCCASGAVARGSAYPAGCDHQAICWSIATRENIETKEHRRVFDNNIASMWVISTELYMSGPDKRRALVSITSQALLYTTVTHQKASNQAINQLVPPAKQESIDHSW